MDEGSQKGNLGSITQGPTKGKRPKPIFEPIFEYQLVAGTSVSESCCKTCLLRTDSAEATLNCRTIGEKCYVCRTLPLDSIWLFLGRVASRKCKKGPTHFIQTAEFASTNSILPPNHVRTSRFRFCCTCPCDWRCCSGAGTLHGSMLRVYQLRKLYCRLLLCHINLCATRTRMVICRDQTVGRSITSAGTPPCVVLML